MTWEKSPGWATWRGSTSTTGSGENGFVFCLAIEWALYVGCPMSPVGDFKK